LHQTSPELAFNHWKLQREVLDMMLLMAMLVVAGVAGGVAATLLMLSVGLSPRALR
jgi:hypothetical protein